MGQNIEIVNLGFSVADAEDVSFTYDKGDLVLEFKDWQEKHIKVKCENTLGFKYQDAEYELSDTERFDSCHIVHDSEWLQEHVRQSMTWPNENWQHYKLNFNAGGVIEVLCSSIAKT